MFFTVVNINFYWYLLQKLLLVIITLRFWGLKLWKILRICLRSFVNITPELNSYSSSSGRPWRALMIVSVAALSNSPAIRSVPIKGAFTHPVSACVFCIALQFFITYLGWAKPRWVNKKLQCNAVNACGNRMCKLSFMLHKVRTFCRLNFPNCFQGNVLFLNLLTCFKRHYWQKFFSYFPINECLFHIIIIDLKIQFNQNYSFQLISRNKQKYFSIQN